MCFFLMTLVLIHQKRCLFWYPYFALRMHYGAHSKGQIYTKLDIAIAMRRLLRYYCPLPNGFNCIIQAPLKYKYHIYYGLYMNTVRCLVLPLVILYPVTLYRAGVRAYAVLVLNVTIVFFFFLTNINISVLFDHDNYYWDVYVHSNPVLNHVLWLY